MPGDLGPNAGLIGRRGGRALMETPALVVEIEVFERNLSTMAGLARQAGRQLRPHAKAHKSAEVARRQVAAGALGPSCVTLKEAEVMAAAGIGGILLTSPPATAAMLNRLGRIHAAAKGLLVVVDHPATVEALERVAAGVGKPLGVLVDCDVGQHRTGVALPGEAVAIARAIAGSASLEWRGIQAYYGHLQGVRPYAERLEKARGGHAQIRTIVQALAAAGLAPAIVSGGGTGTSLIDLAEGPFTEIQPGSYLFMDVQYGKVAVAEAGPPPFAVSLFVDASVVSVGQSTHAVIDAGFKALATDAEGPAFHRGAPEGAGYRFMGDEHGGVVYPAGGNVRLELGARVVCTTPHCDPTVNLYDVMHVVRGEMLEDIWPIEARGH
jgi:D-serine deaminase-like pyridoxal phosphate-dependent protein